MYSYLNHLLCSILPEWEYDLRCLYSRLRGTLILYYFEPARVASWINISVEPIRHVGTVLEYHAESQSLYTPANLAAVLWIERRVATSVAALQKLRTSIIKSGLTSTIIGSLKDGSYDTLVR